MKPKVKSIVALVVVVVSLGLVACAGSQSASSITVEDLTGLWHEDGALQFNEDGTYRSAYAVPWLETTPMEVGQFRLEGTTLTFISSNDSQDCRGQSGSYQVELTEQGQLQLVLQDDPCQVRGNYRPGSWDRIEP
jgi:hypothetical protein